MTLKDMIQDARKDYQKYGLKSFKFTLEELFHGILSRVGFFANYGHDFYDEDWDLLILLDACRWDLMEEVEDEYEFIETSDNICVHSSHSREFLHKTFMNFDGGLIERFRIWGRIMNDPDDISIFKNYYDEREDRLSNTSYISWNVFTSMFDGSKFDEFIPVGRAKWGDDEQILPPREITDRAIENMRRKDSDRTVVHYMQPHTPFRNGDTTEVEGSVWDRIQRGEKDYDEAWEEYIDNLRWVLDDVELLLENVDAEKVVISADHGNAIGEFGCYGHRPYVPLPAVKKVPHIETSATDEKTYGPDIDELENANQNEVEERLKNLGYK